jgi:mediator of RNA polymerase II transcription subunit 10
MHKHFHHCSHLLWQGTNDADVEIFYRNNLEVSLQEVNNIATDPMVNLPSVPPELVKYVEGGRNPDIYTREFVELVRRANQLMRGKMHAFASFRDILAEQMLSAMPELKEDVEKVLAATGGKRPGNGNEASGSRPEG